jgi:hypothetical protein
MVVVAVFVDSGGMRSFGGGASLIAAEAAISASSWFKVGRSDGAALAVDTGGASNTVASPSITILCVHRDH